MKRLLIVICGCALLGVVAFTGNGSARVEPTAASQGQPNPLPTSTPCPNSFGDISGDTFYTAINTLHCLGLISGSDATHFNPTDLSTRAQFARIVVKALDITATTPTTPTFSDVPANYFAYTEIESGVAAGILSGYTQAQCQAAFTNYPCYLPNNPITRAELTKLVVKADQLPRQHPSVQTFSDVPTDYFAYNYIEIAHLNHIISGTDATHFAPGLPIRRDEMASIVYAAFVPAEDAGKTLVVTLFDIGDASGDNYIQLLAPADPNHNQPYPVSFDAYVHDKYSPPGPDIVYSNTDRVDTTRPTYDTNDKWIDLVYNIPSDGSFQGSYFQIQYVFQGQTMDRTTWRVTIR